MGEYDKSIKELNEFISDTTEGNDLREFAFSGSVTVMPQRSNTQKPLRCSKDPFDLQVARLRA